MIRLITKPNTRKLVHSQIKVTAIRGIAPLASLVKRKPPVDVIYAPIQPMRPETMLDWNARMRAKHSLKVLPRREQWTSPQY